MTDDLWRLNALELGARIHCGEVTSREVVEAHLDRIEATNGAINAVTLIQADEALAAADQAGEEISAGDIRGPLHGVPFTTKENIDVFGTPTTEGIVAFADRMPTADAPIVERLKHAGAIPIARTNMPDFGLRVHTANGLHGETLNPWNPGLTCGGSSGGEGAAIAAGMSPMGLGNDIGGSVRNPAYCCGIAALKTTPHRLPRNSTVEPTSGPPSRQLMSVEGPMARHVGDLSAMFAAMHGRHHLDPWSVTTPFDDTPPCRGLKVAVVADPAGGFTAPEVAAGVRAASDALSDAGLDVEQIDPPDIEVAGQIWYDWLAGEIAERRALIDLVATPDAQQLLDLLQETSDAQDLSTTIDALSSRHEEARRWSTFLQDYPIVLGPSWTDAPFPLGHDIAGPDEFVEIGEMLRLIVIPNVLGLPSLALPMGISPSGMPLGVQLIAEHHRDDLCLAVGAMLEAAVGVITPIDPMKAVA